MVTTTQKSDLPWSAIFRVIVYIHNKMSNLPTILGLPWRHQEFRLTIILRPINLLSMVQMTSRLVHRRIMWFYISRQNLGEIDHNLHHQIFDEVM